MVFDAVILSWAAVSYMIQGVSSHSLPTIGQCCVLALLHVHQLAQDSFLSLKEMVRL